MHGARPSQSLESHPKLLNMKIVYTEKMHKSGCANEGESQWTHLKFTCTHETIPVLQAATGLHAVASRKQFATKIIIVTVNKLASVGMLNGSELY